jgi:hypothetical protein
MNRPLIFIAAMATAAAAVTSACLAEVKTSDRPFRADDLRFTLSVKDSRPGTADFHLYQGDRGRNNGSFRSGTPLSELGLDSSTLRRDGPVALALVRQPGRVDCSGQAHGGDASGRCRFTADAGFNRTLAAAGVAQPTLEESYGMTMTGVTRQLVDALRTAGYGPPDPDQLMAFAAVGVDGAYIAELSRRGYRPNDLDDLVAFKAVGVTPAYLEGMAKAGYSKVDGEDIVAMRALDITPEFVAGFARIGYPNLDASKLVELKALGVTPAMVQSLERDRSALSLPQREIARDLIESRRR